MDMETLLRAEGEDSLKHQPYHDVKVKPIVNALESEPSKTTG
jgi:hypothetical protein